MKFLSFIGALAIIAAVTAAVFFFGGFYNVAATQPDPGVVAWALGFVRDASINRHAVDQPPLSMEDPATIQAGARAFASRGCTRCHGGPGVMWEKFSEGLRPDPPDLKDAAKELTPAQIFWVVRKGINMTGMPGFGLVEAPDQEIWTIAAFVKKLPDVSEADYKAWSVDAVAGLVAKALQPGEIEAHHLAAALHDLAGDQHRVDILRAHIGHHRTDGVIKRHDVETVGAQQDDVGLLAGRQRADLAVEAVRPRALDGGELQHLADGQEGRRVLVAGMTTFPSLALLQREHRAHLAEEIIG